MLTLRMAKWPTDTGLYHTGTTWEIATDNTFTNILDTSYNDEVYLEIYYSQVVIPNDSEYYARSKRHFSDGTITDWIGPVKLLPIDASSSIDITPEVYVERPHTSLDKLELIDDNKLTITLKTGAFRCDTDGHKSTSWVLKDGMGKVIYINMHDEVNKTELVLLKSEVDIGNVNKLVLEATHNTINGFESKYGTTTVSLTKFKFEITSNTHSVSPLVDCKITFDLLTGLFDPYPITKALLYDSDNNVLETYSFVNYGTELIIDRALLKEKSTYRLEFYQYDIEDDVKIITINTIAYKEIYSIDTEFVYKNIYIDMDMYPINLRREDLGILSIMQASSEQLPDNGIPMSWDTDKRTKLFNFDRREKTFTLSDLPKEYIDIITKGGVSYKILDGQRMLVVSNSGVADTPVYAIYDYRNQLKIASVNREDEVNNIASFNNLAVTSNGDLVYYFTSVGAVIKLMELNTRTMEVNEKTIRPDIDTTEATLVSIGGDRLLSFNSGNTGSAYVYDASTDSWITVTNVPTKFRTLTMSSFLRKDGNVVSFNTGNGSNDALIFNVDDYTFSTVVNDLDDTIDLDSTIRLRNGDFLRYDSLNTSESIYLFR